MCGKNHIKHSDVDFPNVTFQFKDILINKPLEDASAHLSDIIWRNMQCWKLTEWG